jgi:hypothetical protein
MQIKLPADEIDKLMDYIPQDTEWTTVKQIAEWMSVDHMTNANRIGARLGRAAFTSVDLSYQGSKTRAWHMGSSTPHDWSVSGVRGELDRNESTLSTVRLIRAVVNPPVTGL